PKDEQRSDWSAQLTDAQIAYAARDAAVLLPLADRMARELDAAGLPRAAGIEFRRIPAVAWLEQTGAPLDPAQWGLLSDRAVEEQVRLELEMSQLVNGADAAQGSKPNWSSPAQVAKLLRARGHTIANTDEATLRSLACSDPLAGLLLKYRDARKRASTYG